VPVQTDGETVKQILQNLRSGQISLDEIPTPKVRPGHLLIKTNRSLISPGTERTLVEFGKGNLLQKARSQPDKVQQVLEKIKTDGLLPTLETVFNRLDEPLPLGYCNVGHVLEVGAGVKGFQVGDRVTSNGPHAEVVSVPEHLCARVPEGVTDEDATFANISSIALQGIRLAQPTLGESFVVYGAGLIGLITIQLLKANGCKVLAVDIDDNRLALAERFGAECLNGKSENIIEIGKMHGGGLGVDGVIITASSRSNEIIHQSAQMCRQRGRIILVGVVGLGLNRADFYKKEIAFQVSCSYGPGRYDENYEQKGWDYPLGFVRWTEQRNIQAVLETMSQDKLNVKELITNRVPFSEAQQAYELIGSDPAVIGVILEYGDVAETLTTLKFEVARKESAEMCVAAVLGAGNFTKMTLAPQLAKSDARLKTLVDPFNPVQASQVARKYGFEEATSEGDKIFNDPEINTIFIATKHNDHAAQVVRSLQQEKHVFVEKPLAMNVEELSEILTTVARHKDKHLMVGFNRRFSAHIQKIRSLLSHRSEPLAMNYVCNAGIIPMDAWIHDPQVGGGRIIGEACHFIDLLSYLTGSLIRSVAAIQVEGEVAVKEDKMSILLSFDDGSIGTVNYFGNGAKSFPKEGLEIFSEGRVLRLNNFRELTSFGFRGFKRMKSRQMDKGHKQEFSLFSRRVAEGGEPLIPLESLVNATLASFAAMRSAQEHRRIHLVNEYPEIYDQLSKSMDPT